MSAPRNAYRDLLSLPMNPEGRKATERLARLFEERVAGYLRIAEREGVEMLHRLLSTGRLMEERGKGTLATLEANADIGEALYRLGEEV